MPAVKDGKRTMHLTVRLLRPLRTIDNAFRQDHEMQEVDARGGRLFVGQSPALPPDWLGFIDEFAIGRPARLTSQSCGSILFLTIFDPAKASSDRIVALTFGTGHHALDPDAFVRGFGLRVVLNSVSRNNLRSLDVATLDATTFQKRIQASRNADLSGFGINVERDLLRLAAGVPTDTTFAKIVAGRDSLILHTRTSAADIVAKCQKALEFYDSKAYQSDFDWIDHVIPVQDQQRIAALDALAFAELQSLVAGNTSDLHLALPDVLSPEKGYEIGYFGVGLKPGSKQAFGELAIEDYVAELRAGNVGAIADMPTLKAGHEIRVVKDGESDKTHKRKLYDCFVYELDDSGKTYILFGGDWFQIDGQFHKVVEAGFTNLVTGNPLRASTAASTEQDLIAELNADPDLLKLDRAKVSPAGMKGANFEPCDFFSRTKQFIHLKDGHSSQPISHLWSQGVVSSELFVLDEKFRIDLRKEAIKLQKKVPRKNGFEALLPDGRQKPVPSEYTVVFGIMRDRYKKSGTLGLPFFSKVSLRAVSARIALTGMSLEVHLIERLSPP